MNSNETNNCISEAKLQHDSNVFTCQAATATLPPPPTIPSAVLLIKLASFWHLSQAAVFSPAQGTLENPFST